jgi:hypothetical protein
MIYTVHFTAGLYAEPAVIAVLTAGPKGPLVDRWSTIFVTVHSPNFRSPSRDSPSALHIIHDIFPLKPPIFFLHHFLPTSTMIDFKLPDNDSSREEEEVER